MKKIFYSVSMLALLSASTSCSVLYKQNFMTNPVYSLADTSVTNGKLETDLEMIGEVSATIIYENKQYAQEFKGNYIIDDTFMNNAPRRLVTVINTLKSELLYKAINESGCDIILAPIYTISTEGYYNVYNGVQNVDECTMTIKGYGANIKGVRQIKSK